MAVQDLLDNEEFGTLSPEAKSIVFERLSADDAEFQALSPEAKQIVRSQLIGTTPEEPMGFFELRRGRGAMLSLERIWERLGEAGQAVIDLPSVAARAVTGQGTQEDLWTAIRAVGAPFEPLFAPIGESVRTGAEEFGISPETSRLIGAGTEIGAALALPFVPTKPSPVGRGLQQVGIGRTPEATVQAERAIAMGEQAAARAPKDVTVRLDVPASEKVVAPEVAAELETVIAPKPMMSAEQAVRVEQTITKALPAELQGLRISTETTAKITRAAEAVFRESSIIRDPELPVTIQIVKALHEQPGAFATLKAELQQAGVRLEDFAQAFVATGSSAGRQLNQLSQLSQRMLQVPELAELSQALAKAQPPLTGWEVASHFWGRFVNLWRGSLVTQWATAVRNFSTQAARVGLESIETLTDVAVRNVTKTGTAPDRQLTPALRIIQENFQGLVSRGKQKEAIAILNAFPDESARLFTRFSSDVNVSSALEAGKLGRAAQVAERAFNKAEQALNVVNVLNRGQEYLIRTAAFRAKLAELLTKKGLDINTVAPAQLAAEDIAKAVNHALEMTFAVTPKGGLAKAWIDLYKNPLGKAMSFIAPFPRFMYNAWKFQFEYSPAAFLKLLSAKERSAIAAGDVRTLSRAIVGSAFYYAAWEIRNDPELAGERWYEIKLPDNKRLDVRPYAPFVFPLFVAELSKLATEGKEIELRDMIQGVAASQFRAGAGLYILDEVQNMVSEVLAGGTDLEPATRKARRFVGEIAGGFATPLNTFRELYADYGRVLGERAGQLAEEEGKLREVREEPLLGPVKRRIPFVSQTLPEKELPLRAETPEQQAVAGLSRQLTGLSVQTRTALEAEANRLGIRFGELMPRTGEPLADRLILKHMGPIAERALTPLLSQPGYLRLNDAERRVVLTETLMVIRQAATQAARVEAPTLFGQIQIERSIRPRMRELLIERGALPREFR